MRNSFTKSRIFELMPVSEKLRQLPLRIFPENNLIDTGSTKAFVNPNIGRKYSKQNIL